MRLRLPWNQVVERLEALFAEERFRVVRSFDLQLARESLRDPASCPCPHHGTDRCTCQYLVYLLYADGQEPITLLLHGHDDRTEISIEKGQGQFEQDLRSRISQIFAESDYPSTPHSN